jgi:hypothetical protein
MVEPIDIIKELVCNKCNTQVEKGENGYNTQFKYGVVQLSAQEGDFGLMCYALVRCQKCGNSIYVDSYLV